MRLAVSDLLQRSNVQGVASADPQPGPSHGRHLGRAGDYDNFYTSLPVAEDIANTDVMKTWFLVNLPIKNADTARLVLGTVPLQTALIEYLKRASGFEAHHPLDQSAGGEDCKFVRELVFVLFDRAYILKWILPKKGNAYRDMSKYSPGYVRDFLERYANDLSKRMNNFSTKEFMVTVRNRWQNVRDYVRQRGRRRHTRSESSTASSPEKHGKKRKSSSQTGGGSSPLTKVARRARKLSTSSSEGDTAPTTKKTTTPESK